MRKNQTTRKRVSAALLAVTLASGVYVLASDHGDAPQVSGKSTDLSDLYVFQSPENSNNLVFTGSVQGLLSPQATATAAFDENTLLEFKIDNNNDYVEDLVIQCVTKGGKMYIYGPLAPENPGGSSTKIKGTASVVVDITPYTKSAAIVATSSKGIKAFAGPRDDPFFFDIGQYINVISGTATGFNNPGSDTLAGTNVLSVVVEVPKALLKGTGSVNVWLETKQKN
jgi:hypothetical protein